MVYGTINRAGCFALVVSSEKWSMGLSRGNRDDIQGTMFRGEGEDRPIDRVPEGGRSIRHNGSSRRPFFGAVCFAPTFYIPCALCLARTVHRFPVPCRGNGRARRARRVRRGAGVIARSHGLGDIPCALAAAEWRARMGMRRRARVGDSSGGRAQGDRGKQVRMRFTPAPLRVTGGV